ncbi:tumor necrosis factor alpha-induced protein 2-like [Brachionichthys hirsutus]|uniref:tumor necrosis factor alpha-induced protein 2-like n=1 Tax=Brachionichthys hirsutus TaxID=412623 RepID=UPI003604FCDD
MRLRSQSSETAGFLLNFLPDQSGRPAGGRRLKLPKLWGGQRGDAAKTDERTSPRKEAPQKVILTFKQILEAQHFSEASQLLIETEERLFGDIKETEAFKHHKEDLDKLALNYRHLQDQVLQTLKMSLIPEEVNMDALTSAVKAVKQEEERDGLWRQTGRRPPAWRPCGWKELHDVTLCTLVERRMDNPATPPADQVERPSIQTDVRTMGRQLKKDLLWVAEVVKDCYPPEMGICQCYARLYHQHLCPRLRKIAEFDLEDEDCTFLLRWVNEYYPEIFQKPLLNTQINTEDLGELLPKDLLEPLEEQYLSKQQDELTTYIGRILEEEVARWRKGEEPKREDGCFFSPVAYDVIQFINGMVTSAEKVVGDRLKAQKITSQLQDLMQRFQSFHDDIMKQDKLKSRNFIKAHLGCIEQFSDVLQNQNQNHLFPEGVRGECLCILSDMRRSAHSHLLKPVHDVLKPQYRKLGTSDWLNKPLFDRLLVSMERQLQELQGSTEPCHQKLIGQLHQEVAAEYVKKLLRGEIKLKDKERQLKASVAVKDNADSLHTLFLSTGSKEDWLKDLLSRIAELLRLQDLPAIQMQVASLATAFPDLSVKHVSALLKLKTNLSRADRKTVKETLLETLTETSRVVVRPFFSTF